MPETPTPQHPFVMAYAGHQVGGRYRLTHLIASGGMAEVWEAYDQVLERPVAVKILHPHLCADASFKLRFRGEAVAAARLHHPSIVGIYDTCHSDGLEAIVMELVRGRTLRAYLDERGQLDPIEVVQIGGDVADALEAAHYAGIVHRDIKPANILLSDDARVLVTDFGIAKIRDGTDMTSTGTMLGSVKYLAPEQVDGGKIDPRTDVYALAVVLYEALCGQPPFVADTAAATALARLHQDAAPVRGRRRDAPEGLEQILSRALSRDPDDRYATAGELRTALLGLRLGPIPGDDALFGAARQVDDATVIAALAATTGEGFVDLDADPWGPRPIETPVEAPRAPATVAGKHRRSRRGSVIPITLLALVAAAIGVAALLIGRTGPGRQLIDQASLPDPIAAVVDPVRVTAVTPFDPNGSGTPGENNQEAPLVIDGHSATGWHTEGYNTRRFGNLKSGLGLDLTLERSTGIDRLEVVSPTRGWSAAIYVSDQGGPTLADWGSPVTEKSGIDGNATFALQGAKGRHVLVWITDLGDGPPLVTAEIDEILIRR